ncbi:MAG: PHP domain-containing protein, partial [Planctomycetota bacterium]
MDKRTQKGLQDLGLKKIGELLALPIEELTHRFSDDLVLRIRQLTGDVEEVFTVWHQPKLLAERLDFTGPTNRYTSLLFVLKQAATFLEQRLHSHAAGARRLEVRFHGTDGDDLEFVLDTARPTADADGIATLLISRFEKTRRGDSWFDALTITVPSHEPIAQRQRNLFTKETENTSVDFLRLLDELTGRLGADSVSRAELTYSPHPRDSFRYVPFGSKPKDKEEIAPNPARPSRIDRKRLASVRTGLSKLPDWWDFSVNQTALKVISGPERVAVNTPTDYFHVETPSGERHWVSLSEGIWWFPYELRKFRDDLVELSNAARFDDEIDTSIDYAELVCVSNFSFLRGASTADDLFKTAKDKGLKALAIADLHTFAGMVRAHTAAEEHGLKLIVASRIPLTDGPDICLYVQNRLGYANLCRLLTVGKRRTVKGKCSVFLRDLKEFSGHLHCLVLNADDAPLGSVEALKSVYSDKLSLAVCNHFEAHDLSRIERIEALGDSLGIPLVAVNDVHLHTEEMKELQDVQTCIREITKIDEADRFLLTNTERRIKSAQQMSALFKDNPAWIARGLGIAGSCSFCMNELRYEYPDEIVPKGQSMQEYLEQETWAGARRRYPEGVSDKVKQIILHELELISELDYSAYFLTVYDIVRHARELNILCQGRGSAANSSVCFCLGITSVNPLKVNLLFERFISCERNEPPDIDVDFEHERREEVIQYIYEKYGRHRAGLAATVITYRFKSAVRDVGTALGFSLDQIDKLSKDHQWWDDFEAVDNSLAELGMDSQSENVQKLRRMIKQLRGYPRHLSQHVGGFVITRGRLDELVPIENAAMNNRTVIEWDKSDIEELGLLKVDCLSLGMLTACRKSFALIEASGGEQLDFVKCFNSDPEGDGSTPEAKAIYGMLHKADAIGTFQVESRAQMSMLPRLKPSRFYDLVIEVAIVRPGPIQGQMVHP